MEYPLWRILFGSLEWVFLSTGAVRVIFALRSKKSIFGDGELFAESVLFCRMSSDCRSVPAAVFVVLLVRALRMCPAWGSRTERSEPFTVSERLADSGVVVVQVNFSRRVSLMNSAVKRVVSGVSVAAAVAAGSLVAASPASAADVSCVTSTSGDQGIGTCVVRSGEVRLRADCAFAPDTYSPWAGRGTWALRTGSCLFSIRGVIVETRN
ncbi:hypothetical protein [Amycolatopsis sp. TNS106]|uniref:hypothetical protein n=1 Tax=Amycolatopsis sp. TNS106 TaxID=2861750 RepID=UPI001C594FE1|nr:hypothetical protein [Amycolatopsis sp. TNS106]